MGRKSREQEIASAITKLEEFKRDPAYQDRQYAIEENVIFLKAIQSRQIGQYWDRSCQIWRAVDIYESGSY